VSTAPEIAARHQRTVVDIKAADLGYPNGYALRLKGIGTTGAAEVGPVVGSTNAAVATNTSAVSNNGSGAAPPKSQVVARETTRPARQ
jgi:hypothetical protein